MKYVMIAIGNTISEPAMASTILYVTGNVELPNIDSALPPRNRPAIVLRIAKHKMTINVVLPTTLDISDRSVEANCEAHERRGVRLGMLAA